MLCIGDNRLIRHIIMHSDSSPAPSSLQQVFCQSLASVSESMRNKSPLRKREREEEREEENEIPLGEYF
jgi:hypothetical protein